MQTVFCDEAGFTGDNLLNPDQPYFGYAAVAISPAEAAAILDEMRAHFGLGEGELKGQKLYKRRFAPELIAWLFERLGNRATVSVNDKLYAISAKFFEYVFEPVLAANSRLFYELGFNRHVATILWSHFAFDDLGAEEIVARFEAMLRQRTSGPTAQLPEVSMAEDPRDPIAHILQFAQAHEGAIKDEIDGLRDEEGRIKWVLDLSFGAARSVLCTMGERFGRLAVTFDDSKPLRAFRDFFDGFVGRTDIPEITLGGRTSKLAFSLVEPVSFADSSSEPGLQLADIVASFSTAAFRDRETNRGREILEICLPHFNDESVLPDIGLLDLTVKQNFLNTMLLVELANRARAGEDPLESMAEFYALMSYAYDADPPQLG